MKLIKIHYYSISDIPGKKAHQIQTLKTVKALSKFSKIWLIVSSSKSFKIKINDNFTLLKTKFKNINVKYFKGFQEILNNFLKVLNFLYISYKLRLPDIFYCRDIFTAFILNLLKILHKKPVIFEIHAIKYITKEIDHLLWGTKKASKFKIFLMKLFISKIELYSFKKSDRILPITKIMGKILNKKFKIPSNKIIAVPDASDDYCDNEYSIETCIDNILKLDIYRIVYLGSLAPIKGVDNLIIATKILKNTDLKFKTIIIGGDSKNIYRYKNLINKFNLKNNIIMTGFLSHKEALAIIKLCDLAIISLSKNVYSKFFVSPLKLFDYMSCKIPIIAPNFPSISEVINNNKNGILIEPDNPIKLAETIYNLLKNKSLRKKIGENAFLSSRKYTWSKRAEKICNVIHQLNETHNKKS